MEKASAKFGEARSRSPEDAFLFGEILAMGYTIDACDRILFPSAEI